MKNALRGTHKWCERGMEFLGSGAVLGLLGRCGTAWLQHPRRGWPGRSWCVSINDAVIEKRHPATLPDPPHHHVGLQHRPASPVVLRNQDGLHRKLTPSPISQPRVEISEVVVAPSTAGVKTCWIASRNRQYSSAHPSTTRWRYDHSQERECVDAA